MRRQQRGERGQVAGIEVLPFGLLVFVVGTLMIANLWGVVDAKFAVDAASRDAVRWAVEEVGAGTSDAALTAGAARIASDSLADHGRSGPATVTVSSPTDPGRCDRLAVTVELSMPTVRIPFVGAFGHGITVAATHSELVDPTRSGVPGEATCIR